MLDILLPQCDSRVEVFVSDNCSTDSTPEIIRQYQKTYTNVTYSKNETNIGTDRNIIKCFERAAGDFVWLLSDDDIAIEGSIKEILDLTSGLGFDLLNHSPL